MMILPLYNVCVSQKGGLIRSSYSVKQCSLYCSGLTNKFRFFVNRFLRYKVSNKGKKAFSYSGIGLK